MHTYLDMIPRSTQIVTIRRHSVRVCSSVRRMSSVAAPTQRKHEWIVILPDHEGVLEKRMQVRPDHLKALTPYVENGFWKLGGAILEEVPKDGDGLRIKGSVMLALAESKEEVIKALQEDVYYKSGIWNWDKVQIHPFKSAVRQPL